MGAPGASTIVPFSTRALPCPVNAVSRQPCNVLPSNKDCHSPVLGCARAATESNTGSHGNRRMVSARICYCRPHLTAVPVQAHTVAAVGGFQGDAVDLPAVVHGNPHRTAQAAVLAHHVGFPAAAVAGQNL